MDDNRITSCSAAWRGNFHFVFSSGLDISVLIAPGSYSDNNLALFDDKRMLHSHTVEVMVMGDEKFERWFERKYGSNPAGYLPANEVVTILRRASSKVYAKEVA